MAQKTIKKFNGTTIQNSSFRAALITASAPNAKNIFIEQAQADAQDSGAYTVDVRSLALAIEILDYANRYALEDQLKNLFKRGTRGNLEATFKDDGLDYLKPCAVISIAQDKDFPQFWTVLLQTGETCWRSVSAETDTWTPSGTSGTKTINVGGKANTKLSMTITPSVGPTSGYLKRQLYQLVNVPLVDWGLRPWCLTVDTLALVAQNAHKCQINNGAGIDDSQTTIPYDTVTGTVPSVGVGYIVSTDEQISWTGRTGTTSGNLTGVTRGINGTTASAALDDAEIKVSLIRADMNDYRVWLGDVETKRWIDAPCTTTTKTWFAPRIKPGFSLVLKTAVAASGTPAYLQFTVDKTHIALIGAMEKTGVVYHGNEWFYYSSTDSKNCRLYLAKRGFLETTEELHSAGVTFKHVSTPITTAYGNSSATDPADDDDHYDDDKPMFDLHESDNTKWVYTSTSGFYDVEHPNRPGSFVQFLSKQGNETETYLITENGETGNPVIGVEAGTWLKGTTRMPENVTGGFSFSSPGGIWKVTHAGKKQRSGTKWVAKAGLQKSLTGAAYIDLKMEATPTAAGSYSAFTYTDTIVTPTTVTALAGMFKSLRFGAFGLYSEAADVYLRIEVSGWTVHFVSATLPTGTFLTAEDNVTLDATVANDQLIDDAEEVDSVRVVTPMLIGKEFAINGESNEVTFDGMNAHSAITLNDDSRTEILRLAPGNNELSITSDDMGTLGIALSWYLRRP
ncbi:MAG: hypothetical protein HY865_09640 [Chloroflexi bacterium]|nr:hypothetical protein [Chloroflexota bacterium]